MNTNHKTQILFREVQRFRQWWLMALVIGLPLLGTIPLIYGVYQQIILGNPWGNNSMNDTTLLIVAGAVAGTNIALPLVFYFIKLITEVRPDGIYVRYVPFHWSFQRISLDPVKSIQALTYHPVAEYGGWGIRYRKNRKAYNVSGNRGVRLDFSDGKNLLIGSQTPEELARAIETIWKPPKNLEKR